MSQLSLELASESLGEFFDNIALSREKNTLTHGLHPYPAKFIPHIPRALIAAYAIPEEPVLDPMCGSGTTLVEAAVAGYEALGVDLNPIAVLATRAKTTVLTRSSRASLQELAVRCFAESEHYSNNRKLLNSAVSDSALPSFHRRERWFNDHVSRELVLIKRRIIDLPTEQARTFAECAFSAVLVTVSNQESETRWCTKPNDIPVGATLAVYARRLLSSLAREMQYAEANPAHSRVLLGDARNTGFESESVGLVVTSPPYANSHDYYLYNKLRMFWLGFDVRSVQTAEIGSRHRHSDRKEDVAVYLLEMRDVIREMYRVLRRGRKAVLVVADAVIRGELHSMRELITPLAEEVGFQAMESFEFAHKSFNSTFQKGFGSAIKKKTHVLVFDRS